MNSKMIEELKPCPEMVEKVARAMAQQFAEGARYTPDYIPTWVDKYWDTYYRESAEAAITAYDPDKRLTAQVAEVLRILDGCCECDSYHGYSCVACRVRAALSHNGG